MRISCYTTVPIFQNDYSKLIKYKKIVTFNSFIATQESWGKPWSIGTRNWKVHVEHNWQSHHLQGVPKGLQNFEGDVRRLDFWTNFGHPGDLELFAPFWAISGHFRLGAVHKWRHHFWGVSRPPLPLVIMSSFGYPTPLIVRSIHEKNWSTRKQRTPVRWWLSFQLSCSFHV